MSRSLVAATGHRMPLSGGEIFVGSDPSVQIPVRAELGLLPRHFAVAERDGGWYIGAYKGAAVWVNGQPVSMVELRDGDHIVAGQLELTYRDEQASVMAETMSPLSPAMPSWNSAMPPLSQAPLSLMQAPQPLTLNTFPSLQTGMALTDEAPERQSLERPPEVRPERAPPPRVIYRTELGDVTSMAGGKRDHFWMMLMGLFLIFVGAFIAKMAFMDNIGPLKAADIVVKEGRITGATVTGRKANRTTELHTDLPLNRTIVLPDDLHYNPAWNRSGKVAKIGFEKDVFENKVRAVNGGPALLVVATLELDGTTYRSLAKFNEERDIDNQMFAIAGPGMVLGGLFLMIMGWEKWKNRRAGRE